MPARELDIVVYGATGFTGRLVCRYLAGLPAERRIRFGIAGRDPEKLERIRLSLGELEPSPPVLVAATDEPARLREMASRTRIVISTTGPFARHGPPVVDACVAEHTHYLDITGEPDYYARTIERHHARARAEGIAIVPCCGFDSMPHDLGVLEAVRTLGPGTGSVLVEGFVRGHFGFSGGTAHSALAALSNPRKLREALGGRLVERGFRFEPDLGRWVFPFPTIDPVVVRRTSKLREDYPSDFEYHHYLVVRSLPRGLALASGAAGLMIAARIPPLVRMLERKRPSGEGPNETTRASHWFEVRVVARRGEEVADTTVAGGDPGYDETAKMVAEAALCLCDERGLNGGGVLTPASAFGEALVSRLSTAGIEFRSTLRGRPGA